MMNACRTGLSSLRWRAAMSFKATPTARSSIQSLRQSRHASYKRFPGRGGPEYKSFGPTARLQYIWGNYRPVIVGTGVAGGGFYAYNLEKVPITGRRRFNCLSPESEKLVFGDAGYADMLREFQGKILPESHQYTQLVTRVVERLLPSTGGLADGTDWVVHVIDDPTQKNAFVIPGGKVFVFSGILPICQDENGVAAVLGHEIAHNLAHHSAERMSRSVFVLIAAVALASLFDVSGASSQYIANLLLSLPNSRTQENEADHIGLLMMAQSCFDPNAVPAFWQRMNAEERGAPPQFLSTHPSSRSRIDNIKGWLPEAAVKYENSECGLTSAYADQFKRAVAGPKISAGRPPLSGSSQSSSRAQPNGKDVW